MVVDNVVTDDAEIEQIMKDLQGESPDKVWDKQGGVYKKLPFEAYVPGIERLVKTQCVRRNIFPHYSEALQRCLIDAWKYWQVYDPTRNVSLKTVIYRSIAGTVVKMTRNPITEDRKHQSLADTSYFSELSEICKDSDIESLLGTDGYCHDGNIDNYMMMREIRQHLSPEDWEFLSAWLDGKDTAAASRYMGVTVGVMGRRITTIINNIRPRLMTAAEFMHYKEVNNATETPKTSRKKTSK